MAKFMFVYRGRNESTEEPSPEQMQQVMQAWGSWIQGGTEAGWLLDGGDALKSEGQVVNPDSTVTDGPFAESKELVGGYSMVEAASLQAAVELAKTSPALPGGSSVEVRELAGMGGE